jgi:hypothetical protein
MPPLYLIQSAIEFAILQYCEENKIPVMPGTLWPETTDWLEPFRRMLDVNDRAELRRLALDYCRRNGNSEDNQQRVQRSFVTEVPNDQLRRAFEEIAGVPDAGRADAVSPLVKAILTSGEPEK